jgi:hypothetical protein
MELGLSIAQWITQTPGGRIEVESGLGSEVPSRCGWRKGKSRVRGLGKSAEFVGPGDFTPQSARTNTRYGPQALLGDVTQKAALPNGRSGFLGFASWEWLHSQKPPLRLRWLQENF